MTHLFRKDPLLRPLLGLTGVAVLSTGAVVAGPGAASSGSGGVSGIVQRELIRRQNAIQEGDDAVAAGDKLAAESDYEAAIGEYRRALDLYPKAPIAASRRELATQRFADSSVDLARQRAENGEYDNARGLLQNVLSSEIDPDNKDAENLLEELDDPERWNPANSPEHMAKVQEVGKLLDLARGQINLGQYEEAKKSLNAVRARDHFNTAAERGLEKVERMMAHHLKSSRDHTRQKMLRQVDELWKTPVPVSFASAGVLDQGGVSDGTERTAQKLREIRVPTIQFDDTTIEEAVAFLRIKSRELDISEPDPSKRGVSIVIKDDLGADASVGGEESGLTSRAGSRRISVTLNDVPLVEALRYVTDLANLRYRVEQYAVVVVPKTESGLVFNTRVFKVPPTFISSTGRGDGADAAADDPFGSDEEEETKLIKRPDAKEILSAAGVSFPPESSAFYNPATSQLIVKNTAGNIDLVAQYIENIRLAGTQQVYITTKFVEVTQTNTDELGFDWLLGAFNAPGSDRVFAAGGTPGNAASGAVGPTDFVFTPPGQDVPVGTNPITRGLRFGESALSSNAIDGLINEQANVVSGVTPGVFALSGVFTDPQFQVIVRALDQKRGVDLMSAPSIVTKSGRLAKIEVVREFIYPTEFEPPEIPQDFDSFDGGGGFFDPFSGVSQSSVSSFPVTPTTPTAFTTKNTGVTLQVDPVVGPDGYTIDLNLAPEVIEFEGFINYGSPIQTGATNSLGMPTTVVLTDNRIEQPVFSKRKAETSVTIWDGQTVAIGGLIREDVQTVEDKVPVLGDIPFVGRLFRTKADDHFKRNLVVFVTAKLVDPAGQPIHSAGGGSAAVTSGLEGLDDIGGASIFPPQ